MKVAGYNGGEKDVYNTLGSEYIGGSGHNIKFQRDPEKLLKQYSNLIHKMGRKFGNIKMTHAERQDLYAYISEVFIDLVKEFDMSNGMDFPGYIARMLPTRIRGSYLDPVQDYKQHISPLKDPTKSIEGLADRRYGKDNFTFSYSRRSKVNQEVRRDGKVRGIISESVPGITTNENDNSLAEIHTMLTSQGYKRPELHRLVDLIAKDDLTPDEAKHKLAKEYKLTNDQVEMFYTQLKNLLRAYERS